MGGNKSRVIRHATNIAAAYSTGGYRHAGQALTKAAAQQGTRYFQHDTGLKGRLSKRLLPLAQAATRGDTAAVAAVTKAAAQQATRYFQSDTGLKGRLIKHLSPLAQAATRGDMDAVAAVAMNALAQQAMHASSQGVDDPEGQTYMAKTVKHLARRMPKIYGEFVRNGGNAAGAALLQSFVQRTADMAHRPLQQDQSVMASTSRAMAKAATTLARMGNVPSKLKQYRQSETKKHHSRDEFYDAEQQPR